jgi:hypothetical protein
MIVTTATLIAIGISYFVTKKIENAPVKPKQKMKYH